MLAGLPHSEIQGSTLTSSSPWHIAGSHVLLRLSMPRHPPCALCSLTCLTCPEALASDHARTVPLSQTICLLGGSNPRFRLETSYRHAFVSLRTPFVEYEHRAHTHQHRKILLSFCFSKLVDQMADATRSIVAFSTLFSFQVTSNSRTPAENRIGNGRTAPQRCGSAWA